VIFMKMLLRTCLLLMMLSLSLAGFGQTPVSAAEAAKASSSSSDKAAATPKANRKAKKAKQTTAAAAPTTAAEAAAKTSATTPVSSNVGSPAESAAPVSRTDDATAPSGNGGATITANPAVVAPEVPVTTVSFSETTFDFGKIKQGETVKHKFTITNTGPNPLILENVKPSCGCTALEWPKEPIAPGKSADIEAQFNSTGKSGAQLKNITITLNTAEHLERLTFTGEVIAPPVEAPADGVAPQEHH
jgi:hypothetical protein